MIRAFDIIFSFVALLFLSPIFCLIIICLRFSGEGEIFFTQERVGRDGKLFRLYKFATMLKNSPDIGTGTITIHNDPRILPFGRLLRKTKVNELPQLWNVLVGDMSIIGPRPQTRDCFNDFDLLSQKMIVKVRPGLSGIGSIIFINEEAMLGDNLKAKEIYVNTIMPFKGAVERWFVERSGLRLYFFLIFLTIYVLFSGNRDVLWKLFPDLPIKR